MKIRPGDTLSLFHEKYFMPKELAGFSMYSQAKHKKIQLSQHFVSQASNPADKKHFIDQNKLLHAVAKLAISPVSPFEAQALIDNNTGKWLLVKYVVRLPYNARKDVAVVIAPTKDSTLFIKTAWLNSKDDAHTTLDASVYSTNFGGAEK